MPILVLASFFLIGMNALFVLMEYALVKVRASRLEMLARKGDSRALVVQDIQAHLDDYLAAIQVGLTVIALALGWIGEPTMAAWLRPWLERLPIDDRHVLLGLSFGLALLVLAVLQGVFGELMPRAIGLQKAELVALWGAGPLRWFRFAFRLPVAFMSRLSISLLRFLGFKSAAHAEAAVVSEEEMRILLGETQEKGALPLERLILLENLFDFGAARVSEAMVPRDKIAFLSLARPWEENLALVRARRYSRYPLCEDGLDTVIGMVHVKDLILKGEGAAPDLRRLRRDMAEVVETEGLEKLLKSFPDKGIRMALVRDAHGRITGLLTMEDIVEELIGEVHDEFDLPQAWSLMDVVLPQAVAVQLQAADRKTAIALVLERLVAAQPALKAQHEEILRVVWERETKFSSAVGRGVAVPHGRLPSLDRAVVALGRFAKPVPFPAPDNVPVRLVFLILTPAATPVIQLKVLGRIASVVTNENLRRRLLRAKTAESMLDILRTADTLLAA